MERFREQNGFVNGMVPLPEGFHNAHQKSTYINLYLYICICTFVVEYEERFREWNSSVNETVPYNAHQKSTYIYLYLYIVTAQPQPQP